MDYCISKRNGGYMEKIEGKTICIKLPHDMLYKINKKRNRAEYIRQAVEEKLKREKLGE